MGGEVGQMVEQEETTQERAASATRYESAAARSNVHTSRRWIEWEHMGEEENCDPLKDREAVCGGQVTEGMPPPSPLPPVSSNFCQISAGQLLS